MATNRFGLSAAQVAAKQAELIAFPGITYREATDTYRIRMRNRGKDMPERTTRDLEEARNIWVEFKSGRAAMPKRAGRKTVAGYASDYIEFDLGHRKPGTRRKYASLVSAYLVDSALGGLELAEVRYEDAKHYLTWLARQHGTVSKRPLSYAVVKATRDFLGSLFHHAAHEARMAEFHMPPAPKYGADNVALTPTAEVAPPTDDEVAALVEVLDDEWYGSLVFTLLRTGMRLGEALALEWRHVQPATAARSWARIRIEGTLDVETRTVVSPKSAKSVRTIPIDADVVELLEQHRHRAGVVSIEGYVFTGRNGRPVDADVFRQRPWHRMLEHSGVDASRAARGVPALTPHDLRHYWVTTHLARPGIKIHQVADHIGDTVTMIEKVYRHWLPSDEEAMVAAMATTRPAQLRSEAKA